jgi:uncharacterized glyoxalase superfamily protein PhnB
VQATLATARSLEPKRVLCVFQPHRYSRTKLLRNEFGRAFDATDHLLVLDIYAASEPPIPGISGETICEAVREFGRAEVQSTPRKDQARHVLGNLIRKGDLVIFDFGDRQFGLYPNPKSTNAPFTTITLSHNVTDNSLVRELLRSASQAGARIVTSPHVATWGGYSGCFADLDGHLWEVACPANREPDEPPAP